MCAYGYNIIRNTKSPIFPIFTGLPPFIRPQFSYRLRPVVHLVIPDDTTVGELLDRYRREILPSHKGQQAEGYRIQTILGFLGDLKLIHLTPKEIAKYRDHRLKEVSPTALKRELVILSRVLTLASRDWGVALPRNPVKMITLPKADKARTRRLEAGEEEKLLRPCILPSLHLPM